MPDLQGRVLRPAPSDKMAQIDANAAAIDVINAANSTDQERLDAISNLNAAIALINQRIDALPNTASAIEIAGFRCATAFNVNSSASGVYIPWDDTSAIGRRVSNNITISPDHTTITVAGTPNWLRISVNIKLEIGDTANVQRPNQKVVVERSDGKEFVGSATGYIRDASDHENASHNFTAIDLFPIAGATYRVKSSRESTTSGAVMIMTDHSQIDFEVHF